MNKYALVHLTIIKNRNLDNIFSVEANRNRFLCEISKIKDFFEASKESNWDLDWIKNFYRCFNEATPSHFVKAEGDQTKLQLLVINSFEAEDEKGKIYPYKIRRNPKGKYRTTFNSDKSKLCCPKVYEDILRKDSSLSLCFSKDCEMEKSEYELIHEFFNEG